jgi:hypothetical protein
LAAMTVVPAEVAKQPTKKDKICYYHC